jgi:hypothetical protein
MVGAWRINRYINGRVVFRNDRIADHPLFQFFAADVCQHLSIDFYARGKLLAAFLDHLQALPRIVPDIPIFERKVVFSENGTDTLAPTAVRFEIRYNFWFFHARRLQWSSIHRN